MAEHELPLEPNISNLIESQFPKFYQENGQVLIAFVQEYYKWLEGSQVVSNTNFSSRSRVSISSKSANVIGFNSNFSEHFSDGDTIAIYDENNISNYTLYTIDEISNNTFLTLSSNTLPSFSSSNSWYTTTYTEYNPNYYLRRFLSNKDIDSTADRFLIYFKEKYLKNIQFDTQANIKNLLKHSLDIYRSKGTERSIN